MDLSNIYDPLQLNVERQLNILLSDSDALESIQDDDLHILRSPSSVNEVLDVLSRLLRVHALTCLIAKLFRPIIIDLSARWLDVEEDEEAIFIALAYLLALHPETYPVIAAFLRRTHFKDGPLSAVYMASSHSQASPSRLQPLLVAYYRILWSSPHLPDQLLWPLRPLTALFSDANPHPERTVRYLAIRCYAIQTRMGEAQRNTLSERALGSICRDDIPLLYDPPTSGKIHYVDGWTFPYLEIQRIEEHFKGPYNLAAFYSGPNNLQLSPNNLSPRIVDVEGILCVRKHPSASVPSALVITASNKSALRQIAFNVTVGLPTLITSSPSCGKSSLIRHLAQTLHPNVAYQIVTLHLADTSLDARSLFGCYTSSTAKPGQFEWKDGVLISAMKEGKWIVFKDIDRASTEVLGIILPLLESFSFPKRVGANAFFEVPSRGRVVAADSFAVFATRSVLPYPQGAFSNATFLGCQKFQEVFVPSPDSNDLLDILNYKFPRLSEHANIALIRLWIDLNDNLILATRRPSGFMALEKLTGRVDSLLPSSLQMPTMSHSGATLYDLFPNPVLREEILAEVRDVFVGAFSEVSLRGSGLVNVITRAGEHLGLSPEVCRSVIVDRSPALELDKDANGQVKSLMIGRHRLPARPRRNVATIHTSRPFVLHHPAIALLSRIATCIHRNEPLLLTGETGTGKTSLVAYTASLLNQPLTALNLSLQTETSDLLGGLRPVDTRMAAADLLNTFMNLFDSTFSRKKNSQFEQALKQAVYERHWKRSVELWRQAVKMARDKLAPDFDGEGSQDGTERRHSKKRKIFHAGVVQDWSQFEQKLLAFEYHHVQNQGRFAFEFRDGPLIEAIRDGRWVLLDEINLATSETLECISTLLDSSVSSIPVTERGSLEPVLRHPNFRLFACMNPATDAGKKDLPSGLRSRFTEIYVDPPDLHMPTLQSIIKAYLGPYTLGDNSAVLDVAEFYLAAKHLSENRLIADGSNHRPHYSIRTLTRALIFAMDNTGTLGLRKALWEGCLMGFTMSLNNSSLELMLDVAKKNLLKTIKNLTAFFTQEAREPLGNDRANYQKIGSSWLKRGRLPLQAAPEYIMTPSVLQKISDLARAISFHRSPILIEGPTSSGKTSAIEYIARRTGHCFVRINNHEHTDIQEYLGSYQTEPNSGRLIFTDGVLIRALRRGDWLVLDELNLAPSEVLEALNRLLDDNRELIIPETQEVVKPHPDFMLFATQNPHGLYAGRKVLSRAFRNRFLEFHFDDVPQAELETIICERCLIAPSFSRHIVDVFRELQRRRQASRIFESKQSFVTLRDIFRWANRKATDIQQLGEDGYMLLAERTRRPDDKLVVKDVIESIMKICILEDSLYKISTLSDYECLSSLGCTVTANSRFVWTPAAQRLFTLVARALKHNEPVLLVGEPGSGKTTICHLYADAVSRPLVTVNCHQNTETADLIGGQRPIRNRGSSSIELQEELVQLLSLFDDVERTHLTSRSQLLDLYSLLKQKVFRNPGVIDQTTLNHIKSVFQRLCKLFEWHDGPLVQAMRHGNLFLLDELSLAEDSVLERLNSVLEPERHMVLAENTSARDGEEELTASEGFQILATMNPGGDFGKKELSPALRNRFTEIWVPSVNSSDELMAIIGSIWDQTEMRGFTNILVQFHNWVSAVARDASALSLRDMLTWAEFANVLIQQEPKLAPSLIFHHAAHVAFIDGLPTRSQLSHLALERIVSLQRQCELWLSQSVPSAEYEIGVKEMLILEKEDVFQIGPFRIGRTNIQSNDSAFHFDVPTTRKNAMSVLRACQMYRPILLEGSPGVGKTSLIAALAQVCGQHLYRINLSDQTDLIDLFGTDLPKEGGQPGEFTWKEADFLKAMQEGSWVLLDEMNLAPQSVLEGLNAILDHRGTVYIPELDRNFQRHENFRVFAAQNPTHQGGGRKGLPKSFVDRFVKVYLDELKSSDHELILRATFPHLTARDIGCMVGFTATLWREVAIEQKYGREGSPWEFNLRDTLRWAQLLCPPIGFRVHGDYNDHFETIFLRRFRNPEDRMRVVDLFAKTTGPGVFGVYVPWPSVNPDYAQFGNAILKRRNFDRWIDHPFEIRSYLLPAMESMASCVVKNWLVILTGCAKAGKTSAVETLANVCGADLRKLSLHSAVETSDLLGGFEQVDHKARSRDMLDLLYRFHANLLRNSQGEESIPEFQDVQRALMKGTLIPGSDIDSDRIVGLLSSFYPDHLSEVVGLYEHLMVAEEGQFQWKDGPLVNALRNGYWLLLEDANLCPPSVLDRLNSLCESGGFLVLSERGSVNGQIESITPHPEFRLFMTYNPKYGELSRAMRNRAVEISLPSPSHLSPSSSSLSSCDSLAIYSRGLKDMECQYLWAGVHDSLLETAQLQFTSISNFDLRTGDYEESILLWLLWTTPVNYLLKLTRFWSTNSILGRVTKRMASLLGYIIAADGSLLIPQLLHINTAHGISRGVGLDLIGWQPIDLSANPNLTWNPETAITSFQTSGLILQIALYVHMLSHDEGIDSSFANLPPVLTLPYRYSPNFQIDQVEHANRIKALVKTTVASAKGLINHFLHTFIGADGDNDNESPWKTVLHLLHCLQELSRCIDRSVPNYSKTQFLVDRIAHSVQSTPTLSSLHSHVSALVDHVTPTTGIYMTSIWLDMYRGDKCQPVEDEFKSCGPSGTRRVLDACWKSNILNDRNIEKSLYADRACLRVNNTDAFYWNHELIKTSINGLRFLSGDWSIFDSFSNPTHLAKVCAEKTEIACVIGFIKKVDVISSDITEMLPPLLTHLQWHQTAWKLPALWNDSLNGPANLLRPIILEYFQMACDWSRRSIADFSCYEQLLRTEVNYLSTEICVKPRDRMSQIESLLKAGVLQIKKIIAQSGREVDQDFLNLELSVSNKDVQPQSLLNMGQLWLALGQILIKFYVPDVPLDPLETHRAQKSFWTNRNVQLRKKRGLLDCWECEKTGANHSRLVPVIDQEANAINSELQQGPSLLTDVPERESDQLPKLYTEIWQFLARVLSAARIQVLQRALVDNPDKGLNEERVFQESISSFLARVKVTYAPFEDIVLPLEVASYFIKFGIRLCARHAELKTRALPSILGTLTSHLIRYPRIIGASAIRETPLIEILNCRILKAEHPNLVILRLAAATMHVQLGLPPVLYAVTVQECFNYLARLWSLDRAKQNETQTNTQSWYRQKPANLSGLSEVEEEEEEFRLLFPSYDDESILEDSSETIEPFQGHAVSSAVEAALYALLLQFTEALDPLKKIGPCDATQVYEDFRRLFLSSTARFWSDCEPAVGLDDDSIAMRLSLLHDRLTSLRKIHGDKSQPYNFYSDPNPPEVVKVIEIIHTLDIRLTELAATWPDQNVLQDLRVRCVKLLEMNLRTPIVQVMGALEALLLHSEDWENNASRDLSIKQSQQAIIQLIVHWRQLELSCWADLLDIQHHCAAATVSVWWFRLYDVILKGSLDIVGDNDEGRTPYLEKLIPLLESFMQTSPIIEYSPRLELLRSFYLLLELLANIQPPPTMMAMQRTALVLRTLYDYYSTFKCKVETYYKERRASIENEIRDYIKLASWKDINVFALRESARRSHRRLYKCIRKFREVLQEPALSMTFPSSSVDLPSLADSVQVKQLPERDNTTLEHSGSHDFLLRRFITLTSEEIRTPLQSYSGTSILETLAEIIINTSSSLSQKSIPAVAPDVRLKHIKLLVAQKRRAWVDLLKELKRIGLSSETNPDTDKKLHNKLWMLEQYSLSDELGGEAKAAESYFLRLLSSVPELERSLADHNADLPTRELQRGTGFAKNLWSMALSIRSKLAISHSCYEKLQRSVERLKALELSSNISFIGRDVQDIVNALHNTLLFVRDALEELILTMNKWSTVTTGKQPWPAELTHTLNSMIEEVKKTCGKLQALFVAVSRTTTHFLTNCEAQTLLNAKALCKQIKVSMERCKLIDHRMDVLASPLLEWLSQRPQVVLEARQEEVAASTPTNSALKNVLLVVTQDVLSQVSNLRSKPDSFEVNGPDGSATHTHKTFISMHALLRLELINNQLDTLVKNIGHPSGPSAIIGSLSYLDAFLCMAWDILAHHARWAKALFKLSYIVCSVTQALSSRGFCKPMESEKDDVSHRDDTGGISDGTGLGEGQGEDNITGHFEDQSQVEGMREEAKQEQDKTEQNGDAMEVDELSDEEQDNAGREHEPDDSPLSDEDEESLDEQVGGVDPTDPNAVDEKLWNGGDASDKSGHAEKADQPSAPDKDSGEVTAQASSNQKTIAPDDFEERAEEGEEIGEVPEEPIIEGDGLEASVPQVEILDLPENLENLEMDGSDPGLEEMSNVGSSSDDGLEEKSTQDIKESLVEQSGSADNSDLDSNVPDTQPNEIGPTINVDPEDSQGVGSGGNGGERGGLKNDEEQSSKSNVDLPPTDDVSKFDAEKQHPSSENLAVLSQAQETSPNSQNDIRGPGVANHSSNPDKDLTSQYDRIQSESNLQFIATSQEIEHPTGLDTPIHPATQAGSEDTAMEFLPEGAVDHDLQALASTTIKDATRLRDLGREDFQEDDSNHKAEYANLYPELRPSLFDSMSVDEQPCDLQDGWEKAIRGERVTPVLSESSSRPKLPADQPEVYSPTSNQENIDQRLGHPDNLKNLSEAEKLWRLFESNTHDLSYILCEQLRLVLEPTMASRLKGDYRTGKRLNMRKIIPYIASDYTKDKIWLRRTNPSRREYQVMVVMDDSKSMSESRSIGLAFQTLALVSMALNRLEVGDIAIARFGESFDVVHDFDSGPFTSRAGAKVVSSFGFDQGATDMPQLIQKSLEIFANARRRRATLSSSATDLWQLEIIISDGVCQSHSDLRALLRRAEEERLMIVFIILDSLQSSPKVSPKQSQQSQHSILSMQQVAYKNVDGRMEIDIQRYLDTFPFDYFVVLRDVTALPDILSNTLRQFFEKVAEQ